MIDRDSLEQLFAQYGWPMDSKEFPTLNQVFTQDAKFTVQIAGGDTYGPIEGREAIYDFVSQTVGAQTDQRRHVITNMRVESSGGDTTTATAILTLLVIDNGQIEVKSSGLYRGVIAQEDGEWRFSDLHLYLDLPF
jgi:hypothetical protein